MFCRNCGYESNRKSVYCSNCGEPLSKSDKKIATNKKSHTSKFGRYNKNKNILMVGSLLVITFLLFGGYFFNSHQDDTESLGEKSNTVKKVIKKKATKKNLVFRFKEGNQFGLMDEELNVIKEPSADYLTPMYSNEIAIVKEDINDSKMNLITNKGKLIELKNVNTIGAIAEIGGRQNIFSPNGVASFGRKAEKESDVPLMGLISKDGKIVKEPFATMISSFTENGYATYQMDEQVGVLNEAGEPVIEPLYKSIVILPNDLFMVARDIESLNYDVINKKGEVVKEKFSNVYPSLYDGGLIFSNAAGKYGFATDKLTIIKEPFASFIKPFRKGSNVTPFKESENGLFGLVNCKGDIVLAPTYYEITGFNERGVAGFQKSESGASGLLNQKGEVVKTGLEKGIFEVYGSNLFMIDSIKEEEQEDSSEDLNTKAMIHWQTYELIDSKGDKVEGDFTANPPGQLYSEQMVQVDVMTPTELKEEHNPFRYGVLSKDGKVLSLDAVFHEVQGDTILIQESDGTCILYCLDGKEIRRKLI